jgi:hypothetical protein
MQRMQVESGISNFADSALGARETKPLVKATLLWGMRMIQKVFEPIIIMPSFKVPTGAACSGGDTENQTR